MPVPRPETGTPSELMHSELPVSAASAKKQALVVLGMHRSGTSALTRVLNLLGADVPSRLLDPNRFAVRGYWESADLVAIHDRLLEDVGLAWDGVLPISESWWHSAAAQGFQRDILEVLRRDFGASSLFVIKDPRICRLLPLWMSVLAQFGTDPSFILCIRNPLEVIDSLKVRNGFNPARSALLWLRYVVESEIRSRGHRRAIVSYESLLRDWRGVAERLARELEIVWPRLPYAADLGVEGFLDTNLRHEERTHEELRYRRDLVEWVRQVYAALLDAERGDQRTLADTIDGVSRQLELADRAFVPILLELDQRLQGSEKQLAERERVARELGPAQELAARQRAEITALQDQIAAVQQGAVQVERELGAIQDRFAAAERHAIALRQQREDLSQEVDRLGARLVEKDEALDRQRVRIVQLETAFQSLRAERDAGASRACELEATLAGRDLRIGHVERELRTVLDSTCWKVTGPARRWLSGNGWGARLTRRGTKVLRRALAFQWHREMLTRYLDRRVIEASRTFDPEWYLANNPDVAAAGIPPLVHYLRWGAREGRDPNRLFDTSWYVEQNPHVALAGRNPLAHYVRWGVKEGRDPNPGGVCF
jgi:hypothetical protein